MKSQVGIVSLLLSLLLTACAGPGGGAPEGPGVGWTAGTSLAGMFDAKWRAEPAPIPDNASFELDVVLTDRATGAPMEDVQLFVSAWMPDHGHGMVRNPEATHVGDGVYRVRGMLFHMPGEWQLFLDVVRDGISERAAFDVVLE